MYFYLKSTTSSYKTLIFLKYYINSDEKRFVYSTNLKIHPEDWNFETKSVNTKRGRVDLSIINKELNYFYEHLDKVLNNFAFNKIKVTKETLKEKFDLKFKNSNGKQTAVLDYYNEFINEKKETSTVAHIRYKNAREKLVRFQVWSKKEITFDTFIDFSDFPIFCREEYDLIDNTINKNLIYIKSFLIWAYKKKLHDIRDYSHLKYKNYETDSIALSKKQVLELYNFEYKSERLQKVVDLFLIGCFTGQRFSDYSVFDLNDYNNGIIEKRQQKTQKKVVIPVDSNKYLKELLHKYNFDLPKISTQKFNPYLREAISMIDNFDYNVKKVTYKNREPIVEIFKFHDMISSHTARRTFISITLQEGWTYKEVMQISGISNINTLLKYDKISIKRLKDKVNHTWK